METLCKWKSSAVAGTSTAALGGGQAPGRTTRPARGWCRSCRNPVAFARGGSGSRWGLGRSRPSSWWGEVIAGEGKTTPGRCPGAPYPPRWMPRVLASRGCVRVSITQECQHPSPRYASRPAVPPSSQQALGSRLGDPLPEPVCSVWAWCTFL